jgi:hypothetical protein
MRQVVCGGHELGHRLPCDQLAVVLVPVLSSQPAASPSARLFLYSAQMLLYIPVQRLTVAALGDPAGGGRAWVGG